MWLDRLVREHPVFERLPDDVKDKLLETPDHNLDKLGLNRRLRRRLKARGAILHLYARADEGYTLLRAMKEVGGDNTVLIEVDVLRDPEGHDMLRRGGIFPTFAEDGPRW